MTLTFLFDFIFFLTLTFKKKYYFAFVLKNNYLLAVLGLCSDILKEY